MPTPAFISIHGKNQGHITKGAFTADSVGNVYVEGHEDEILAQEVDHQIAAPTDPQSPIYRALLLRDKGLLADLLPKRLSMAEPEVLALRDRPFPPFTEEGLLRVLVTGGSQGARVLSEVVPDGLAMLPPARPTPKRRACS